MVDTMYDNNIEKAEHLPAHYYINRDWKDERFHIMLDALTCDTYGHIEPHSPLYKIVSPNQFDPHFKELDTNLFTLRAYYWGDIEEVYQQPNFVYKPWDLYIDWYKWPMRDASANFPISNNDWEIMCNTIERAAAYYKINNKWPSFDDIDVDDFPRMSETQELEWNMRKKLNKAWEYSHKLENLLFAFYNNPDDILVRNDVEKILAIGAYDPILEFAEEDNEKDNIEI